MNIFIAAAALLIHEIAAQNTTTSYWQIQGPLECRCCQFLDGRRLLEGNRDNGQTRDLEGKGKMGGFRGGKGPQGNQGQGLMAGGGGGKQRGRGGGMRKRNRNRSGAFLTDAERKARHEEMCKQFQAEGVIDCVDFDFDASCYVDEDNGD